jgi:hypothetical protein
MVAIMIILYLCHLKLYYSIIYVILKMDIVKHISNLLRDVAQSHDSQLESQAKEQLK